MFNMDADGLLDENTELADQQALPTVYYRGRFFLSKRVPNDGFDDK